MGPRPISPWIIPGVRLSVRSICGLLRKVLETTIRQLQSSMLSNWNLANTRIPFWRRWFHTSRPRESCQVCGSLYRAPSQKVIDANERVLFSVSTGLLKKSAAKCPVCEAFYMAVTKYPWPSERPSDRILRPQSNDQNRVLVSTDGVTLKMVVASNLNDNIVSPALYMYTSGFRTNQVATCAKVTNI